jgi:dihydroorotase-like cyclic amidohydrolase
MSILLKNGSLKGEKNVDILIEKDLIVKVAPGNSIKDDKAEVFDLTGLIVLPGLVDLHTHLREPGREDAETVATGSAAAARGGFTAVHAMANTLPVADTAGVVEQVWNLGRKVGLVDVYPIGAVTVGLKGENFLPWQSRLLVSEFLAMMGFVFQIPYLCAEPWNTLKHLTELLPNMHKTQDLLKMHK